MTIPSEKEHNAEKGNAEKGNAEKGKPKVGLLETMKAHPVFAWILVFASCIGAIWGLVTFLDSRIEQKLNEEAFLHALAGQLRPMLIFDEYGVVLTNIGARELLEKDIEVSRPNEGQLVVTITPKIVLSTEPVVVPLDGRWAADAKRKPPVSWVFTLGAVQASLVESSAVPSDRPQRFRLEIIR